MESGNPEDNGRQEKGKQGKGYTKAPGKNETQDNTRKELLKIKIPTKSQRQDLEITVTTEVSLLCVTCETGKPPQCCPATELTFLTVLSSIPIKSQNFNHKNWSSDFLNELSIQLTSQQPYYWSDKRLQQHKGVQRSSSGTAISWGEASRQLAATAGCQSKRPRP